VSVVRRRVKIAETARLAYGGASQFLIRTPHAKPWTSRQPAAVDTGRLQPLRDPLSDVPADALS
jgi:hypothetical protein